VASESSPIPAVLGRDHGAFASSLNGGGGVPGWFLIAHDLRAKAFSAFVGNGKAGIQPQSKRAAGFSGSRSGVKQSGLLHACVVDKNLPR